MKKILNQVEKFENFIENNQKFQLAVGLFGVVYLWAASWIFAALIK